PGVTYQSFIIDTNLAEDATLLKFELELNGIVIMQARGVDLKSLDAYKQILSETGRFVLDLSKQEFRSLAGVRMSELVTEASDQ
ncbi:major capsid protein P2, partial [Brevibacterium sp. SIMBA_078]|uniref:major capsid protein P2 n=1 Tax=Brevibacterium sp. SIMBA_078 TaxID=3085816 RepID=UPI00397ABBC3